MRASGCCRPHELLFCWLSRGVSSCCDPAAAHASDKLQSCTLKKRIKTCVLPGQRASRDVRRVARVLHVTLSHVVVEVGLWDLLPGVHRHLPRQKPVTVTDRIQREVENQKYYLHKGKSKNLL